MKAIRRTPYRDRRHHFGIQVRHSDSLRTARDQTHNVILAKVVEQIPAVDGARVRAKAQTTSPTEPAGLMRHQVRASPNVAAPVIHDVARPHSMAPELLGEFLRYARDAVVLNTEADQVLGHDHRNALGGVISFMKLTAKRAGLNSVPSGADTFQVSDAPPIRNLAERGCDARVIFVTGEAEVDEHPRISEAEALARGNGVRLAVSNPCFEVWEIAHFLVSSRPMRRDEAQRELSRLLPSYHHDRSPMMNAIALEEKRGNALANASRCLRDRCAEGCPRGNPSTEVGLLD